MLEQFLEWCYQHARARRLRDPRFGMPISQSFHIFGITVLLGDGGLGSAVTGSGSARRR